MHLTGLSFIIKYRFYIIDNKECETMTEEKKTNTPETEEVAESRNFILNFIDEDIAEGGQFTPVSRRSLTAICTSDTARR